MSKETEVAEKAKHEIVEESIVQLSSAIQRLENFSDKVSGNPMEVADVSDRPIHSLSCTLSDLPNVLGDMTEKIQNKIDCLERDLY